MKAMLKNWLIIGLCLFVVGSLIFVIVMSLLDWNFSKLGTIKYQRNNHEINAEFNSISVNADTTDLFFIVSDDGKCRVECYEEEKSKHSVKVENDTLVIDVINSKSWYDYIGINFDTPKITVYLPKSEYQALTVGVRTGDVHVPAGFTMEKVEIASSTGGVKFLSSAIELLQIKTGTGYIDISDISAGKLNLTMKTGNVKLKNIQCRALFSVGSTGDILLEDVTAGDKISIVNGTGDVELAGCDANEISAETSTGSVKGTLLSEKIFLVETSTGDVDVPPSTGSGRCQIKTSTGNVEIKIK